MIRFNTNNWVRLSLFSLHIVAFLGVIMRYKIGYSFPFFDQKNLQYGHSHFAFSGWVSQTIFVLIINMIENQLEKNKLKLYNYLLIANWVISFAMLFTFSFNGYDYRSIILSSLSIVVAFILSILIWNDIKLLPNKIAVKWIHASISFMVISTLGTFMLTWMMITKNFFQQAYLSSVYWYLHFQYNGWFLFACIGLLYNYLGEIKLYFSQNSLAFKLLTISCIPTFGLSILWLKMPFWVEILIAVFALLQLIGWFIFIFKLMQTNILKEFISDRILKIALFIAIFAGCFKFILQLCSTMPFVSQLAFGFRPIVIAYLHLVLLAFISVLLITYIFSKKLVKLNRTASLGLIIFLIGILFNEILLAIQGIASFSYTIVPAINVYLFIASFVLLIGTILLVTSQIKLSKKNH